MTLNLFINFLFSFLGMTIMEIQLLFRTNIDLQFPKEIWIYFHQWTSISVAICHLYKFLFPLWKFPFNVLRSPSSSSSISQQTSSPQSFITIPLSEAGTGQHSLLYCCRQNSFWNIKEVKARCIYPQKLCQWEKSGLITCVAGCLGLLTSILKVRTQKLGRGMNFCIVQPVGEGRIWFPPTTFMIHS